MSDFLSLSVHDVCLRLTQTKAPLFVLHNRPDGDTVGSGVALVRLCRAMGKTAHVACIDPIPRRLDFIPTPDEVLPLPITGEREVIAVDVASPMQLGGLREVLTGALAPCFMIDHHEVGEPFCDHLIVPDAAAAGCIVFAIAEELLAMGAIAELPEGAVAACFAALSSDTGCFRFSNAGADAHMAAARMIAAAPRMDTADINLRLFDSKFLSTIRAEAFAGANMEVSEDGGIAWLTVTALDRADFDLNEEDFETAIDVVRALRGVKVAFTVKENRDGKFKASLRSTGLNVAEVAQSFYGGGHDRAAGCAVPAKDINDAVSRLLAAIRKQMAKEKA